MEHRLVSVEPVGPTKLYAECRCGWSAGPNHAEDLRVAWVGHVRQERLLERDGPDLWERCGGDGRP